MRTVVMCLAGVPLAIALAAPACGGTAPSGFGMDSGGGSGGAGGASGSGGASGTSGSGGGSGSGGTSGIGLGDSGGDGARDGGVVVKTYIYANTDTQLYTVDPSTTPPTVAVVGTFMGMGGTTYDSTVTDVAVNAEGAVYANTETVVYSVVLPATPGPTATVALTKVATIVPPPGVKYDDFYALAFAPKGFLGPGEALLGGDSNGEVWSIDTSTGAVTDLGNFGPYPGATDGSIFALSGDLVFYTDSKGIPTGLATIRKCAKGGSSCTAPSDFLAGIDMTSLQTAYMTGTKASTLLGGIYGGTGTSVGSGTGYAHLYGLGAWEENVYAFQRVETGATANPPNLISIDTTTGAGSVSVSGTLFSFTTGGWSGAGVSTNVTIKIKPPPPPPK